MKKKNKYIIIILIAIMATLTGITLAKYITEEYHGYYTNAKDFSFTSNILKEDANTTYNMNNWSGAGAFDITFDLSSKKNNLYFTDYDIPYEVSYNCPSNVACTIDKNQGIIFANDPTHTDTVTLHIEPLIRFNEGDTLTFQVSAQSISPYVTTLYATYNYIVTNKGISYTITDNNSVYVKLTVTNAMSYCRVSTAFGDYEEGDIIDTFAYRALTDEEKEKCISAYINVIFNPEDLIIDTTDNIIKNDNYQTTLIDGTSYINKLSINVPPVSAIDIKFYKTDPNAYYGYDGTGDSAISVVTYK